MKTWRITKYDPKYRDNKGSYIKNEWTSISDIGERYDDKEFTIKEYLEIENKYIEAINLILECTQVWKLKVCGLEKPKKLSIPATHYSIYSQEMVKLYQTLKEGQVIGKNEINILSRLILREELWCELESETSYFNIKFGYDFYLYISTSNKCDYAIQQISENGLFMEHLA